jgi:hypothetical protein
MRNLFPQRSASASAVLLTLPAGCAAAGAGRHTLSGLRQRMEAMMDQRQLVGRTARVGGRPWPGFSPSR